MNIKKVIEILVLLIIFMFFIINYTYEVEGQSMEYSIKLDKREYKKGDEILIDVYVEETEGFSGISIFTAKKVYNAECLEYIGTTTIDGWKVVADAINVLIRKMEGEDVSKGKLCTLKFKVLKEVNTTVQLSEIDACGDDGDVYYEDGNVNEPSVEINFSEITQNASENKSYTGIILIAVGLLGLGGVSVHYILNKKK